MALENQAPDLSMDAATMYREESFTDGKVGTIRRLSPVTADGETDASRSVQYFGQTQMLTPMGALPLNFEIEADSLSQAIEQFAAEAEKAAERTIEELKEMRRESASQIVVPEAGGGPGGGGFGGGPGGGMPGGGLQIP